MEERLQEVEDEIQEVKEAQENCQEGIKRFEKTVHRLLLQQDEGVCKDLY